MTAQPNMDLVLDTLSGDKVCKDEMDLGVIIAEGRHIKIIRLFFMLIIFIRVY
jgi:hypothetical protein